MFNNSKKICKGKVILIITLTLSIVFWLLYGPNGEQIKINGNVVANVKNIDEFNEVYNSLSDKLRCEFEDIKCNDKMESSRTHIDFTNKTNKSEIEENILKSSFFSAKVIAMRVNGKEVGNLSKSGDIKLVLDKCKDDLLKKLSLEKVNEVNISSKIDFVYKYVPINEVNSIDEVANSLIKKEPIHFNVVGVKKQKLEINPSVEIYNSSDLLQGENVVKQEGKKGIKDVTKLITYNDNNIVGEKVLSEEIIENCQNKIILMGNKNLNVLGEVALLNPSRGVLTSSFGERWGKLHKGIDIGGKMGAPIYAAADGVVEFSAYDNGGYGYLVKLKHADGKETYYGHCSSLLVSVGDKISRGDTIALVGSSGDSTGPHLHFEVRVNGVPQNPLNYLREGEY